MKVFRLVAILVVFLALATVASAQVVVGFDYTRTGIKPNFADPLQDVDSYKLNALVQVAGKQNGFKLSLGGEVQKSLNREVISNYLGTGMNIYRDPYTYFGVGELAYVHKFIKFGARAKLGAEKLHEDFEYKFTRAYEFRGTLNVNRFGVTPLFIGFKKEPLGFSQYFGAGVEVRLF